MKVLEENGVIPGLDMTTEAGLAKLCYILGIKGLSDQERRDMMKENLRGEITVSQTNNRTLMDNQFVRAVTNKLGVQVRILETLRVFFFYVDIISWSTLCEVILKLVEIFLVASFECELPLVSFDLVISPTGHGSYAFACCYY